MKKWKKLSKTAKCLWVIAIILVIIMIAPKYEGDLILSSDSITFVEDSLSEDDVKNELAKIYLVEQNFDFSYEVEIEGAIDEGYLNQVLNEPGEYKVVLNLVN